MTFNLYREVRFFANCCGKSREDIWTPINVTVIQGLKRVNWIDKDVCSDDNYEELSGDVIYTLRRTLIRRILTALMDSVSSAFIFHKVWPEKNLKTQMFFFSMHLPKCRKNMPIPTTNKYILPNTFLFKLNLDVRKVEARNFCWQLQ